MLMPRSEYLPDEEHNAYYNERGEEGDQVSSTFEGRHVTIAEGWLYHDTTNNSLVQKGQPVSFSWGDFMCLAVGIALKTASSMDDFITIDTEGIWRVKVLATNDIYPGQVLWIGDDGAGTDGVILDDPTVSSGFPQVFGYAVEPFTFTTNGEFNEVVMAVKVHWMAGLWFLGGPKNGNGV
jgi:hypothetical protein